jgi:hypothetical protein
MITAFPFIPHISKDNIMNYAIFLVLLKGGREGGVVEVLVNS